VGYFLRKKNLVPYLEYLKKEFDVIVPVQNSRNATVFEPWKGQELFIEKRTIFSPKKFFLPNLEREFLFEKKEKGYKIHETIKHKPRVIFGIRSCDLHAIGTLDKLFLEFYGYDLLYRNKRNTTFTIGLSCAEAAETCFCGSMNTHIPDFFDLFFWEKKDGYFVEIGSARWEKLLHKKFFESTSEKKGSNPKCPVSLDTKNIDSLLMKNFGHVVWEKEAEKCLSCSSCTQICPTCYCFLVLDNFLKNGDSERYREWDSCQLQRFSKIHGAIFRKTRKSRLRQFVMHKLSYFKEDHGIHLCVGCGRCIKACPAKISLVDIAKTIQGEKNA